MLRGNHPKAIFDHGDDYPYFERFGARLDRYAASVLAYHWMTNHVHHAIRAATGRALRKQVATSWASCATSNSTRSARASSRACGPRAN